MKTSFGVAVALVAIAINARGDVAKPVNGGDTMVTIVATCETRGETLPCG